MPTGLGIGARAFAAGDVDLEGRVSVVALVTDLTVVSVCGVTTAVAVAGQSVTRVSVTVALARLKSVSVFFNVRPSDFAFASRLKSDIPKDALILTYT